jgi:flagellar basal-body rod protein FlgB
VPAPDLFSGTISLLEKSLNLRSMRHRVLTSNIANIDTPNYKAFEIEIEKAMNKNSANQHPSVPLAQTDTAHLPLNTRSERAGQPKVKEADPPGFSLRGDGNTVDLDKTMGNMAENAILYKTSAQLISRKFVGLMKAIKGGR